MTEPEATMTHLTIDPKQWPELLAATSPVEVRTPEGRKLGVFTPVCEEDELYARALALFDVEEARNVAARERGDARPTAEVLDRIRRGERSLDSEKPWTEEEFRASFDWERIEALIAEHRGKGRSLREVLADLASGESGS